MEEGLSNDNTTSPGKIPADSGNDISKEAVQMHTPSLPEFSILQDKVEQLEEWLRDSGMRSEIITFWNITNELKVAISKEESRTQNAEARCTQLTQTNDQLFAELNSDRAGLLEKRLRNQTLN